MQELITQAGARVHLERERALGRIEELLDGAGERGWSAAFAGAAAARDGCLGHLLPPPLAAGTVPTWQPRVSSSHCSPAATYTRRRHQRTAARCSAGAGAVRRRT